MLLFFLAACKSSDTQNMNNTTLRTQHFPLKRVISREFSPR